MPTKDPSILRILDASLNRAGEGLRVVEDYVRFVLDDAHLTTLVKTLRHDFAQLAAALPVTDRHAARETEQDVGTQISTESERQRQDAWDVCAASFERTKQSLRSLEEYGKAALPEITTQSESLRYRLYTIERAVGITRDSSARLQHARLCVLIDGRSDEREFVALVTELLAAEVSMIQLRDKRLGDAELVSRARQLVELTRKLSPGSSLRGKGIAVINNRPDIAAAADADGVHLGQDDLNVKDARDIVGVEKLIGVSTHNLPQARAAVLDGANYLGVGPTFPSETKSFDTIAGLDFLRQVASEISLPAFAIGGISAENLDEVLGIGMTRIAVSSGIVAAQDPGAAAQELLERLTGATAH